MGFSSANKSKPGKTSGKGAAGKPAKKSAPARGGFASRRRAQEEEEEEEVEEVEDDEEDEEDEDEPPRKSSKAKGKSKPTSKTPARGQERARASASARRGKGKKRKSNYSGVSASEDRDPVPCSGDYFFEFQESDVTEENNCFRAKLLVIEVSDQDEDNPGHLAIEEGGVGTYLQSLGSADAERMGRPAIKRLVMAFAGYDDEELFEEKIPNWELLCDAVEGGEDGIEEFGENPLAGRKAYCQVYYRSEDASKDGKPYRGWRWKIDEDGEPLEEE